MLQFIHFTVNWVCVCTLIQIRYTLHHGPHLRNMRHPATINYLLIGKKKVTRKSQTYWCVKKFWLHRRLLSVMDTPASVIVTLLKGVCNLTFWRNEEKCEMSNIWLWSALTLDMLGESIGCCEEKWKILMFGCRVQKWTLERGDRCI